eukprot:6204959-Pleurochrysis_carterae.AAC.4
MSHPSARCAWPLSCLAVWQFVWTAPRVQAGLDLSSIPFVPKSAEAKVRIKECVQDSILFQSLDEKTLEVAPPYAPLLWIHARMHAQAHKVVCACVLTFWLSMRTYSASRCVLGRQSLCRCTAVKFRAARRSSNRQADS